jgi:hypothetical protein
MGALRHKKAIMGARISPQPLPALTGLAVRRRVHRRRVARVLEASTDQRQSTDLVRDGRQPCRHRDAVVLRTQWVRNSLQLL